MMAIAALLFLASWCLPVVEGGTSLAQGGLPGWQALRVALSPVWPYEDLSGAGWFLDSLAVLSGLTNVVFISAWALTARTRASRSRLTLAIIVMAVLINISWILRPDVRSELRGGYYLWMTAFLVLAAARLADAFRMPTPTSAAA